MSGEFERAVLKLVCQILGGSNGRTAPKWLVRPGRVDCGAFWPLICDIYRDLTNLRLPEMMPNREWRRLDCVSVSDSGTRIIEVDEAQHFNRYRAKALRLYPQGIQLAFDAKTWIEHSDAKIKLEAGGFAKPRPPLFPEYGGRHLQRAFRDALCDILPAHYGYLPTLRIAHFEVDGWLGANDAPQRMESLLQRKISTAGISL
jgi:hypothetical protein